MADFEIHTHQTAGDAGKAVLDRAQARMGFVPNFIAALAEAPVVAEAYLTMMDLLNKASLSPSERHVVWFTANMEHGCHYCMAAHSAIAHAEKIPAEVVEAARSGEPYADQRLEALRQFTLEVVRERGWVAGPPLERILAAGFTKQNVLEVVLAVSHKVLSNYINHIVDTPVDAPFQKFAWEPKAKAAE